MDHDSNHPGGLAGIILCGGKSSRMGQSKAGLVFGNETLLQRVVRRLGTVVGGIVVVAAADQTLPPLSEPITLVHDRLEFAGPLAGMSLGLEMISVQGFAAAYVTSCDVPFLQPSFVQAMAAAQQGYDIAVPFDELHYHPLAAVYDASTAKPAAGLLAAGKRRPRDLFDQVRTRKVATRDLEAADPGLRTLVNLNTPEDYRAALLRSGLPLPDWLDVPGKD